MITVKERDSGMEIQTTVKELPDRIRQLKISPETIVRVIIDIRAPEEEEKDYREPKKSKWAAVADRISETSLSAEAAKCMRNASREFRENFRFRSPPHFEHIENDD